MEEMAPCRQVDPSLATRIPARLAIQARRVVEVEDRMVEVQRAPIQPLQGETVEHVVPLLQVMPLVRLQEKLVGVLELVAMAGKTSTTEEAEEAAVGMAEELEVLIGHLAEEGALHILEP